MSDSVRLDSVKTISLKPEHLVFILNMLSECKFKDVRLIITDIMGQLQAQEGVNGTTRPD